MNPRRRRIQRHRRRVRRVLAEVDPIMRSIGAFRVGPGEYSFNPPRHALTTSKLIQYAQKLSSLPTEDAVNELRARWLVQYPELAPILTP